MENTKRQTEKSMVGQSNHAFSVFCSKECLDKILSLEFHSSSNRRNFKDNLRCVSLINRLKNERKYISTTTLKAIKEKYKPLVDRLKSEGVISVEECEESTGSNYYSLVDEYKGETVYNFSKQEQKIIKAPFIKASNRGKKATTSGFIQVEISKALFLKLYNNEQERRSGIVGYDVNNDEMSYETQWQTIEKINKTGRINPYREKYRRLYSYITGLSSFVHPFITINGRNVVELDLHATYWMLLPKLLMLNVSCFDCIDKELFYQQIQDFKKFLSINVNVYDAIADNIGETRDNVKQASMTFICSTNAYVSYNQIAGKIQKWFKHEYSELNHLLNILRPNACVSYRLQSLESSLFVDSAIELTKQGVDVITKHDSILCFNDDLPFVEYVLKYHFHMKDIEYRCRVKKLTSSIKINDLEYKDIGYDIEEYKDIIGDDIRDRCVVDFLPLSGANDLLSGAIQEFKEERSDAAKPKFKREKQSEIKKYRNGYRVSIKNQYIYSKKNETLEAFKERIGGNDMAIDKTFLNKVEDSFKQQVESPPDGQECFIDGKSDKDISKNVSGLEWNDKYEFSSVFDMLNGEE